MDSLKLRIPSNYDLNKLTYYWMIWQDQFHCTFHKMGFLALGTVMFQEPNSKVVAKIAANFEETLTIFISHPRSYFKKGTLSSVLTGRYIEKINPLVWQQVS